MVRIWPHFFRCRILFGTGYGNLEITIQYFVFRDLIVGVDGIWKLGEVKGVGCNILHPSWGLDAIYCIPAGVSIRRVGKI